MCSHLCYLLLFSLVSSIHSGWPCHLHICLRLLACGVVSCWLAKTAWCHLGQRRKQLLDLCRLVRNGVAVICAVVSWGRIRCVGIIIGPIVDTSLRWPDLACILLLSVLWLHHPAIISSGVVLLVRPVPVVLLTLLMRLLLLLIVIVRLLLLLLLLRGDGLVGLAAEVGLVFGPDILFTDLSAADVLP